MQVRFYNSLLCSVYEQVLRTKMYYIRPTHIQGSASSVVPEVTKFSLVPYGQEHFNDSSNRNTQTPINK
jgi:hypothetical protein